MKKSAFLFLILFISAGTKAQPPNFSWAKQIGTTQSTETNDVAVDTMGNLISTGYFWGTVDFDPGIGVTELTCAWGGPYRDVFVYKLDGNGGFKWARSFAGKALNNASAVAVDPAGNVYVSGIFKDSVDFDPGNGVFTLISKGFFDGFIVKLDLNGNFIWAKSFGGTGEEELNDIAVDRFGNVVGIGNFQSTVDFDPGTGVSNLTAEEIDIFVVKLDGSGNFTFGKQVEGYDNEHGRGIAVDDAGKIYFTGDFNTSADFDPSPTYAPIYGQDLGKDIFVCKWNADGKYIWAKSQGGSYDEYGKAIAVDGSGNVVIAGYFSGLCDFDPTNQKNEMSGGGLDDMFVSKFDGNGNWLWTKIVSGVAASCFVRNMVLDNQGGMYFTGNFFEGVDFDPGSGSKSLGSPWIETVFVLKLDAEGIFKWAVSLVSSDFEMNDGLGIAIDKKYNVFVGGYFGGTVDFNPGSGTFKLTAETTNIFALKLTQPTVAGIKSEVMSDVLLYPNPCQGNLQIRLNSGNDLGEVEIFNIQGTLVSRATFAGKQGVIDVRGLPVGVYFLSVKNVAGMLRKKLIIE